MRRIEYRRKGKKKIIKAVKGRIGKGKEKGTKGM